MENSSRAERRYGAAKPDDRRTPYQIDRDRICYCNAFRRLAQVTQVVSASEGSVFHNRLTHSLKVAQVGRRLAEKLLQDSPGLAEKCGGLDPDVVEAAALAHDLGHPPFGHVAERQLNELALKHNLVDGFEGNAQTFRILTSLETNRPEYYGLDLTRATLNATLKYPWFCAKDGRDATQNKRAQKYSVYDIDKEEFQFVRPISKEEQSSSLQTLEASIMDFADDVTYSVHDFEDFYVAGLIPLRSLLQNKEAFSIFIRKWSANVYDRQLKEEIYNKQSDLQIILELYPLDYQANPAESLPHLKRFSSGLIQKYIYSVSITENKGKHGYLDRPLSTELELQFLQEIVKQYVIFNPRLTTQHHGQRQIILKLFEFYLEAIRTKTIELIPLRFLRNGFSHKLNHLQQNEPEQVRIAVDIVASFTELESVTMYRRLLGIDQGSVMDYII